MLDIKKILLENIKIVKFIIAVCLVLLISAFTFSIYSFIKNKLRPTEKYVDTAYMIFLDKPKYRPNDINNYPNWITQSPPPALNANNYNNTTFYMIGKKINNSGYRLGPLLRTNIADVSCSNEQQTNEVYNYIYQQIFSQPGITKVTMNGQEYISSPNSSLLKSVFDTVENNLATCQSYVCTAPTTAPAVPDVPQQQVASTPTTTVSKEQLQSQLNTIQAQVNQLTI